MEARNRPQAPLYRKAEAPSCVKSCKAALTGTSYLAFSQWYIAAEMPPHLTCINPTEGLSDGYRDLA
ncbi:CocE/NonD family hydrolase, partial [Acinetobacter ursingii]|uniref:CocE/NonD family hydrolase n=1 Tax=Acinetobacter ursingii TaxID=108980 RepID=UPI003AF829EB